MNKNSKLLYLLLILFAVLLSACNGVNPAANDLEQNSSIVALEPAATSTPTPTPEPPKVTEIRNQAYSDDGTPQHQLDIYLPPVPFDQYPTIILLHGGGSNKAAMRSWGYHFANQGYTTVSVEFRDYPDFLYPDAVEDVFCAAAWIAENAEEFSLTPKKLVVLGHSIGGTLASMLAVVDQPETFLTACPHEWSPDTQIIGAISFTGVFDYPTFAENREDINTYAETLLGGSFEDLPEIWTAASPQSWISGDEPPFLLIHGGLDRNIPAAQSEAFKSALELVGIPVEFQLLGGMDHYGIIKVGETAYLVNAFLDSLKE